MIENLLPWFIILGTFSLLILVHELGHFWAAKKVGIKVLEFGLGLPPRIISKKIGETVFSFNWLPIGGFVKLLGEDESDPNVLKDPRSFASQSVDKRILVVVAGVVMNLLLAWILYTFLLAYQGFKLQIPLVLDHDFVFVVQTKQQILLIQSVAPNSPAAHAGLKSEDRILAVNGQNVTSVESFIDQIKKLAGQEVTLTVSDYQGKDPRTLSLVPRTSPPPGEGALGVAIISLNSATLEYSSWWQKLLSGPIHSYNVASYAIKVLSRLVYESMVKKDVKPVSQGVGGPVAIGFFSYEILKRPNPLAPYLDFLASLSLSLSVFNILPFPALDGGRLSFLLIEAITKRRVNPKVEQYIHTIGMAILLALFVLIFFSDVNNYVLPFLR